MRISTDRHDPAFRFWLDFDRGPIMGVLIERIECNGCAVRNCVVADEEQGYVEVNLEGADVSQRRREHGHVRIVWTEAGRKLMQADQDGTLRAVNGSMR